MEHGKKRTWVIVVVIIVILLLIVGGILGFRAMAKNKMSPFEWIQKKGAKPSENPHGKKLNRYDYGDYGFFSNNRVAEFSTKRMGTYDKDKIRWDDGSEKKLKDIF
jgi:uncharacterized protein YxeA